MAVETLTAAGQPGPARSSPARPGPGAGMMTPAAPKEQQQILISGVSTHVSAHVLCVHRVPSLHVLQAPLAKTQ